MMRIVGLGVGVSPMIISAQATAAIDPSLKNGLTGQFSTLIGAASVLVIMGLLFAVILTTRRLKGSSLFNRLFIIVAVASGFFSGIR